MIPLAPLPVIPMFRTGPHLGRRVKIRLIRCLKPLYPQKEFTIVYRKFNHTNTLTKNKDAS
jgi:hypothetical protein